jgi:hypothetical protein
MTRCNPPTTPIASSKSAALSRATNLVSHGYQSYVTGTCPAQKMMGLLAKFHHQFGIGCSPAQRHTRQQVGQPNSALVVYWPGFDGAAPKSNMGEMPLGTPMVEWLLLVTPGPRPAGEREVFKAVTAKPPLFWLGYELIRHCARNKASWTWRRHKEQMAEWYALLGKALNQRGHPGVPHLLNMLARQPGFAGVRKQSKALFEHAGKRGYAGDYPYLFYLDKQPEGAKVVIPEVGAGV